MLFQHTGEAAATPQARMKGAAVAVASMITAGEEAEAGEERSRRRWLGHRLLFVGMVFFPTELIDESSGFIKVAALSPTDWEFNLVGSLILIGIGFETQERMHLRLHCRFVVPNLVFYCT